MMIQMKNLELIPVKLHPNLWIELKFIKQWKEQDWGVSI